MPKKKKTKKRTAIAFKEAGNRLVAKGEYQAAFEMYKKGLKLNPEMPELYHNIATVLMMVGEYRQAHLALLKAIQLRPDYAKAKAKLREVEEKFEQSITLFESSKPDHLIYNGERMPRAEVEKQLGKRFCHNLQICAADLISFLRSCQTQLPAGFLAQYVELPQPLSADYFDIVDMGDIGHGLRAHRPIKQGTLITYYLGRVLPKAALKADSVYAASVGREKFGVPFAVDLDDDTFSIASLMQHLPAAEELRLTIIPEDGEQILTENVYRSTILNVFTTGEARGHGIIALVACRDISAGELLGISYGFRYWASKGPVVYFNTSSAITHKYKLDPSFMPTVERLIEAKDWPTDVTTRVFDGKPLALLDEEFARGTTGEEAIILSNASIHASLARDIDTRALIGSISPGR